jgi:integrase
VDQDEAPGVTAPAYIPAQEADMRGDGTLYRRGRIWWLTYYHEGDRYSESAETDDRDKALRLLRKRLRQAHGEGDPAAKTLTVDAALDALVADQELRGAKAVRSLRYHVKPIRAAFAQTRVSDLTPERLTKYVQSRQKAHRRPATINRETGALVQSLRLAQRRGRIRTVPYIPRLPERNIREGFLSPSDFARLSAELPPILAEVARFAYATGWRKSEILSLRWDQVDWPAREVRLYDTKSGEGRVIPVEGDVRTVLARRRSERGIVPWVFHRKGRRWVDITKPWAKAIEAAKLPWILFHDLRRSAVRNMVAAGVDQKTVMQIVGHRTASMFLRYQIVSGDDMKAAMKRTADFVARRSTQRKDRSE